MQPAARKGNKGMQEEDEEEDEGKKKKNKTKLKLSLLAILTSVVMIYCVKNSA
jgi:hypothetical protein